MIITDKEIAYIETNLEFYGIRDTALREDLIDHICSCAEQSDEKDFDKVYKESVAKFGGYHAIQLLQQQLDDSSVIKAILSRKRHFYMLSSGNFMILALGLLFKLNQWPYANIIVATASFMLIFLTIPFWFYERFKYNA